MLASVMALNYAVSFLLLMGTRSLSGQPGGAGSAAVAALLGTAYAGACMLRRFSFLGALHWRLVSLGMMSVLAFGPDWKRGGVFALLAMALDGTAAAVGRGDGWPLLLSAVGVFLLTRFAFRAERQHIPLLLEWDGRQVALTALADTGNELHDPITGERVLVIGEAEAQQLTGLTHAQLSNPLSAAAEAPIPGLRLIPYQSVGKQHGMLLAIRCAVSMGGRMRQEIVAMAPQNIGGEDYQALAGGFSW